MIDCIARLLGCCGDAASVMPPTELYNEGWMLRIALDWYSGRAESEFPFTFVNGARWYSEGRLASQFLARTRGDPLAEGYTHADGVVGHFGVSPGERSDVRPRAGATQLTVIEAKLGSPLAAGTKNAPDYDQAARSVACLAHVAGEAGIEPGSLSRFGFYVVAPESQVRSGVFDSLVTKESVAEKVRYRVSLYGSEKDRWYSQTFLPHLATMSVALISWESVLDHMESEGAGVEYRRFYEASLTFVPKLGATTWPAE